jgi:hypothetical protein
MLVLGEFTFGSYCPRTRANGLCFPVTTGLSQNVGDEANRHESIVRQVRLDMHLAGKCDHTRRAQTAPLNTIAPVAIKLPVPTEQPLR